MLTTTPGAGTILPADTANDLIIRPLRQQSIAFNPAVATTVVTGANEWRAPRLDSDVTAAFVAEGEEIPVSDIALGEVVVTPAKAAALSIISRELGEDSSPEAQTIVGQSMVADLVRVINGAFLGNQSAPAPAGLGSLTDTTGIPLDLADLDSFSEAQFAAEGVGASLTAFLVSPADALILAQLKVSTGSNETLLGGQRTINGLPLVVARDLPAGTVYGVDSSRLYSVLRQDVTLNVSKDAYFSSDRIGVKSTVRVGFGYADPASVVKLTAAAA